MQHTERAVRTEVGDAGRALPSPRAGVALGAVGAMGMLGYAIVAGQGYVQGILFAIGILLGVALYHARFGFTSAFRQLVAVGQGAGLRAHMLMVA
ncbi:MAG: YeeE/YedE family protein, partial [Actinomycetota bacterium]